MTGSQNENCCKLRGSVTFFDDTNFAEPNHTGNLSHAVFESLERRRHRLFVEIAQVTIYFCRASIAGIHYFPVEAPVYPLQDH
jgi:hypothetical protein